LVAAVLMVPLMAVAQTRTETALPADMEAVHATAPVIIDGTELFRVRGVAALPAAERARLIAGRIEAFAANTALPVETLRLVDQDGVTAIHAGKQMLLGVTEADARIEDFDRKVLAELYRQRVAAAVTTYRADRVGRSLVRSSLYALAATALLLALLWGMHRLSRWFDAAVERRIEARIKDIRFQSFRIVQAEPLRLALRTAVRGVRVLLWLLVVFVYLDFVLSLFPWTRPLARRLVAIVVDPLRTLATGLLDAVPNMIFLVILFYAVRYALKMIRLFFGAIAEGRITPASFERDWAWPTYRIVRILVVAFAVVVAYPYIPGSDTEAFKGVSLFLGVIFSLGSTSVIANVIAGYTMTYRRAFHIGDRVKIGDHVGDVVEQRLLVTRLRTPKNEEVVIPNSVILNGEVVNYSTLARDQGVILHTTVGIGYETPWRQVEAMLLQAAERTPGLPKAPAPFVLQQALGDFCVTYQLNVYCDQPQQMAQLYSALHRNILDMFNEYGVQIMTPAYEGDPAQPKVVPKEQWYAAPARGPGGTEHG
jgi:small-conductance mechanosensitive channel